MQQSASAGPGALGPGDVLTDIGKLYPDIAEYMTDEPYFANFRTFDYISTLRLISLQARLATEESELKRLELIFPQRDASSINDCTPEGNKLPYSSEQLRVLDSCEAHLRDYCESAVRVGFSDWRGYWISIDQLLLQTAQIAALPQTSKARLEPFRSWLHGRTTYINASDRSMVMELWGDSKKNHFVSLSAAEGGLSNLLQPWTLNLFAEILAYLLTRLFVKTPPGEVCDYESHSE
jgi:hypothetical protein